MDLWKYFLPKSLQPRRPPPEFKNKVLHEEQASGGKLPKQKGVSLHAKPYSKADTKLDYLSLNSLKVSDLRTKCKDLGLRGYSQPKKPELIAMLLEWQKQNTTAKEGADEEGSAQAQLPGADPQGVTLLDWLADDAQNHKSSPPPPQAPRQLMQLNTLAQCLFNRLRKQGDSTFTTFDELY